MTAGLVAGAPSARAFRFIARVCMVVEWFVESDLCLNLGELI